MKRIGMGLVGPGFVAEHHIEAVRRLGYVDVIALAGSSQASAEAKARAWHVGQAYQHYEELIADPRIQVVHNTTPNHLHHAVNQAALKSGKHIISDKPLARTAAEGRSLWQTATGVQAANLVTFNYRGNPMVQEARFRVEAGELGDINFIHGHYLQEWLTDPNVYGWRSDPALGGESSALGDIGSHFCDLIEHVSGLKIESVLADVATLVPVRYSMPNVRREAFAVDRAGGGVAHEVKSEDLASVLLRFDNGARGAFTVGQALPGHKNDLKFEICGRKASVSWAQERAHEMTLAPYGEPKRALEQEFTVWGADAKRYTRLPPGHHQGWADSFRNIIADAYQWIGEGAAPDKRPKPLATFQDGYRSGRLIEAMLVSARKGGVWTPIAAE